ncbi:hypothetical protein [Hymenobacter negativus]|uniref:Uncharacterized protein n=1 Tax=Hymenobacter negativus TaxID=2795026 RepID=A0ABS3Q8H1_9BACT|nr:hypothetical protein [Hymenobacter negativus]MBO2007529.1 hypothetical protein [Hymenobacter negativus]
MKGLLMVISAMLFVGQTANAQTKVANYSIGKYGTDKYEHFSFYVKDGHRAEIYYRYGKVDKEFKVTYLNKLQVNGSDAFKVKFSNGHTTTVIPSGIKLKIADDGETPKIFTWEYEGPVNGVGTFCQPCTEDEKEAIQLVKAYYLK